MALSISDFILITLVMSVGAALQASVGYGMGLIVTPVLVLVDPNFLPGALFVSVLPLSILIISREKSSLQLNGLGWAVAGRVLGAWIAVLLISMISQRTLVLVSGVVVLFAVSITVGGIRIPENSLNLSIAGTLSGIMGTIASIGGPPMALILQHGSGARIRTSLSGFFLAGTLISVITLVFVGGFGWRQLVLGLSTLPGAMIGFLLSSRIFPWLDGRYTRAMVLSVATISALVVIANQIW